MDKTTLGLATPLRDQLDRLAAFEPSSAEQPVLSLYLDLRPDQHGRDNYEPFLRRTFPDRARALNGEARKSFERDAQRIREYLERDVKKSTNGLAIFACGARDLFEAVQLDAPMDGHWLFVGSVPHLYPLARVNDQFPRYAALLVNTNTARLFVFSLGATEAERRVIGEKTRRTAMGGWSQARYQRHTENFHLHHMKEAVDMLDRVVREEAISQIVVSCDDTTRATLFDQLPLHLKARVIDTVNLDIETPAHAVLADTLAALREQDARTDAERVQAMLDAWQSGGLAVAGPEGTMQALMQGQVEELLITASPELLRRAESSSDQTAPEPPAIDTNAAAGAPDRDRLTFADTLVTRAQQTSARIRFIEDAALLAEIGGVGALLRFSMRRPSE